MSRAGNSDVIGGHVHTTSLMPGRQTNLDSPIRRRCTPTFFPAILGLHLDKRATLVKDVSVWSSSWGAMKHEASWACSHHRLSNVIFGWRCRATIRTIIREPAADLYPEPCCRDGIDPSESF